MNENQHPAPYGAPTNADAEDHVSVRHDCTAPADASSPLVAAQWGAVPPGGQAAPTLTSPPVTATPRAPRFSREQVVAAVLAAAGGTVTLIGVVLLLVMAAREGLLTQPVRVGGGAVLAAALAGAAAWVRPRPGGRVGSIAFLATSVAAAYFDVMAVTSMYHWVPMAAGLAVALAVAAAAGAQAMRWDEKWLFALVTAGVAVLAPALTGGVTGALIAFFVVIQVAGVAPEQIKGWDELSLVRTLPAVIAASGFTLVHAGPRTADGWLLSGVVVIALVGFVSAVLAGVTRRRTYVACAALALSWAPVWFFALRSDRLVWAVMTAATTLAAAAGFVIMHRTLTPMRWVFAGLGALSAFSCAVACARGDWRALPILALALAGLVVLQWVRNSALVVGALGLLAVSVIVQGFVSPFGDLFYRSRAADLPSVVPTAGLLLVAAALLGLSAIRGRGYSADVAQAALAGSGAAGLLGGVMALVGLLGRTEAGFFLVHLLVTVLVLAVAALVLTKGLTHPRHLVASMVWGLALVGCALAKLMLFDLHYMGSVTKALTFVAAGLVLLAAGTSYARTYAAVSASRSGGSPSTGRPRVI